MNGTHLIRPTLALALLVPLVAEAASAPRSQTGAVTRDARLVLGGRHGVFEEGIASSEQVVKRFDRYGIRFHYPESWFVTTRPLSNGTNPVYRFAVSTVPVRRTRADEGPCLPGVAKQLPAAAVLAFLREALGYDRTRSLPRMPRRPRNFRLPNRSDSFLCGFKRGSLWLPFRDRGRAFYLGIYVGPEATAAVRRALKLDCPRVVPTGGPSIED